MVNKELFDYIKEQLAQGVSKETIKSALLHSGWQGLDAEEAFNAAYSSNQPKSPIGKNRSGFMQNKKAWFIAIGILGLLAIILVLYFYLNF